MKTLAVLALLGATFWLVMQMNKTNTTDTAQERQNSLNFNEPHT